MAFPVITNNTSTGVISWTAFRITYGGNDYPVSAGSTNKRFVYWSFTGSVASTPVAPPGTPTGGSSNIVMVDVLPGQDGTGATSWDNRDQLLFVNKQGVGLYAGDTQIIDGSLLVNGSIFSDAIATNQILAGHIKAGEITGDKLHADTITGDRIMANQLTGSHMIAGTIGTNALSVGTFGNTLAPNGFFEDWGATNQLPDGWALSTGTGFTGATVTKETNPAISGTNSIGVAASAGNQSAITTINRIPCRSGEDLVFEAYFAGVGSAVTNGVSIGLYFWDSTGNLIDIQSTTANITGSLTVDYVSHIRQAPTGAYSMTPVLFTATTNKVLWDLVSLNQRITNVQIANGAVTADKIKSGEVWAGTMPIGNLTTGGSGGTVSLGSTQLTATGASGGFVKLSNAGVELFDSASARVVNLPTDISTTNPATFRGSIDAQGLNSALTASFSGTTRLEQGSTTYIGLSTQPPSVQPVVTLDWPSTQFTGYDWAGFQCIGLQWDSAASQWIVSIYGVDENNGNTLTTRVLRYNSAGVYQSNPWNVTYLATQQGGGAVYLNSRYYLSFTDTNVYSDEGYHRIWCSNATDLAHNKRINGRDNSNPPTLFTDGTDLYFVDQDGTSTNRPYLAKVASGSGAGASIGSELVANSSFETNTTGWTAPVGGLSRVTPTGTTAPNGTWVLQMTGDGSSNQTNQTGAAQFAILAGTYYTASMQFYLPTSNTYNYDVTVWFNAYKSDGTTPTKSVKLATFSNVTKGAWTTADVSGYATRDAALGSIGLSFTCRTAVPIPVTDKIWIDQATVKSSAGYNQVATYVGSPFTGPSWGASTGQLAGAALTNDGSGSATFWVAPTRGNAGAPVHNFAAFSGATWQANDTFPTVDTGSSGTMAFTHNGTSFYSMDNAGILYQHLSGTKWTTESSTWWVGNTYQDTAAPTAETTLGPLRSFTMKKRARLTVTSPDLSGSGTASDPNTAGHYLARGASAPAWDQIFYQGNTTPVAPSKQSIYVTTAPNWTGNTNPVTGLLTAPNPASNSFAFPTGTAAKLVSSETTSNQLIQLSGDGSGRVGPLSWNTAGVALTVPDGNPVGTVIIHGAPDSSKWPPGYVWCNGQSLSTTTYAALFAVIGYEYGGSGASFNVPDLQRRFLMGADGSGAALRNPGSCEGGTLAEREDSMYHSHSHTMQDHTHFNTHTHTSGSLTIASAADRASGTGNRGANPVSGSTGGSSAATGGMGSVGQTSTVSAGSANGGVASNGVHAFMSLYTLMKF